MSSFKSFLSAFGHDFVAAFSWLGSSKGQAVVTGAETATEAVLDAVNPALGAAATAVITLINSAMQKAIAMEASAAAVGAQAGTGAQKAAAVIAELTPQTASFLQSVGISAPTAAESQALATTINNAVVGILNAIPAPPAAA